MVNFLITAFKWLISASQLKFIVIGLIGSLFSMITYYIVPKLIDFIAPAELQNMLNAMPESLSYFLYLTNYPAGMTIILSAYFARFTIRRLPFIG